MKPGFIITDNPSKFKDIIENAKSKGWSLNVGNTSEIKDEKYIFIKYLEDTDFYTISDKIRKEKLEFYSKDGCLVEVKSIQKKVDEAEEIIELPIPQKQEFLEDTALVMVFFHYYPIKMKDAIIRGVEQLRRLNPMPKIIFYEAGDKPELKEIFKKDTYKFIQTTDKNLNLWQKEPLFNLIVKENPQFKNYIFHDADTFPDSPDWALAIKRMLENHEYCIIQNGYHFEDTIYKNRNKLMYVFSKSTVPGENGGNPGLTISMSKKTFDYIGGFLEYFVCGAGDAGLVLTTDKTSKYRSTVVNNCGWWEKESQVLRNRVDFFFIPYKLTHFSHGAYEDRGHFYRNKALEWLGITDIRDCIKRGENGLMEYIKYQKEISYILGNKPRLKTTESSLEVVREALLL